MEKKRFNKRMWENVLNRFHSFCGSNPDVEITDFETKENGDILVTYEYDGAIIQGRYERKGLIRNNKIFLI